MSSRVDNRRQRVGQSRGADRIRRFPHLYTCLPRRYPIHAFNYGHDRNRQNQQRQYRSQNPFQHIFIFICRRKFLSYVIFTRKRVAAGGLADHPNAVIIIGRSRLIQFVFPFFATSIRYYFNCRSEDSLDRGRIRHRPGIYRIRRRLHLGLGRARPFSAAATSGGHHDRDQHEQRACRSQNLLYHNFSVFNRYPEPPAPRRSRYQVHTPANTSRHLPAACCGRYTRGSSPP